MSFRFDERLFSEIQMNSNGGKTSSIYPGFKICGHTHSHTFINKYIHYTHPALHTQTHGERKQRDNSRKEGGEEVLRGDGSEDKMPAL